MASQGVETEKKYDVGADAEVPDLDGIPGVGRVGEPHVDHLEAVYFDTEDSALAARRHHPPPPHRRSRRRLAR